MEGFRGNKSYLPTKPCLSCGRPMSWRKAWAAQWEQVKYCSERCRKAARAGFRVEVQR
ncbi:MAG: DUF2256 domain-containing protein [Steroidobacteraceae bacterium]